MNKQQNSMEERVARAVRGLVGGGDVEVVSATEAGEGWLVVVGEVRVRGFSMPFKVPVRVD